jgi:hypothetical protein
MGKVVIGLGGVCARVQEQHEMTWHGVALRS